MMGTNTTARHVKWALTAMLSAIMACSAPPPSDSPQDPDSEAVLSDSDIDVSTVIDPGLAVDADENLPDLSDTSPEVIALDVILADTPQDTDATTDTQSGPVCPGPAFVPTDLATPDQVGTLVMPVRYPYTEGKGCVGYVIRTPDGVVAPAAGPVSCPSDGEFPGVAALPGGAVLGFHRKGVRTWHEADGTVHWDEGLLSSPNWTDDLTAASYLEGKGLWYPDEAIVDGNVALGKLYVANGRCAHWKVTYHIDGPGKGMPYVESVEDKQVIAAVLARSVVLNSTPGSQPLTFPVSYWPYSFQLDGGYDLHADLPCPFDAWAVAGLDATHAVLLVKTDRKHLTRSLLRMTLVPPDQASPPPEPFLKEAIPLPKSVVDVTRGHDGKLYVLVLDSGPKGPRGYAMQVTNDGAVVSSSAEVPAAVARVASAANGDVYIGTHWGPIYWLPNDGSKKAVPLSGTYRPGYLRGRFDVVP